LSRRRTPRMGIPSGLRASRSMVSWTLEPTRLRTTPATLTFGSNVVYPWTMAATERDIALASTTSTTGASSSLATWAVEARSPPPLPSKRPMTPSITAMSAPRAPWVKRGPMRPEPERNASRLRPGLPAARVWYEGSIKSGPTLKGATRKPSEESAAISPEATVVLPTPEWVLATTIRGVFTTRCLSGPCIPRPRGA
jgi:hypothetical protein